MDIDQKHIIKYFGRNGFKANEIYEDRAQVLESEAVSHSIVTYWLREARFASHGEVSQYSEPDTGMNEYDEAIACALNN
jgi:hypothetical protein